VYTVAQNIGVTVMDTTEKPIGELTALPTPEMAGRGLLPMSILLYTKVGTGLARQIDNWWPINHGRTVYKCNRITN